MIPVASALRLHTVGYAEAGRGDGLHHQTQVFPGARPWTSVGQGHPLRWIKQQRRWFGAACNKGSFSHQHFSPSVTVPLPYSAFIFHKRPFPYFISQSELPFCRRTIPLCSDPYSVKTLRRRLFSPCFPTEPSIIFAEIGMTTSAVDNLR